MSFRHFARNLPGTSIIMIFFPNHHMDQKCHCTPCPCPTCHSPNNSHILWNPDSLTLYNVWLSDHLTYAQQHHNIVQCEGIRLLPNIIIHSIKNKPKMTLWVNKAHISARSEYIAVGNTSLAHRLQHLRREHRHHSLELWLCKICYILHSMLVGVTVLQSS